MTTGEAVLRATKVLEEAGSLEARLEAEVLVMHLAGLTRAALFRSWQDPMELACWASLQPLLARRKRREPLAYITGHREFYGLDFLVNRHVLIPRPETELLVEAALDRLAANAGHPLLAADIGTGSGAIAVCLATRCRDLQVYAIDASVEALEVARTNAQRHQVADRVHFLQGDLLEPLPQPVDLVVANLPYLRDDQVPAWCGIGSELAWEPLDALAAGPDGLKYFRKFFAQGPRHLRSGGAMLLEVGWDQGAKVRALAQAALPESQTALHQDLAGLDRMVSVWLPSA